MTRGCSAPSSSSRRTPAGFTLIEILIALAILALLSVLAYRAVASLTESETQLSAEARRWRTLDGFFARLEADVRQAQPRAVRTGDGPEPPWLARRDPLGNAELKFSRAHAETDAEPASAGQRLGYRLAGDAIEVLYWPRLDNPRDATPAAYVLVSGVRSFVVDYLDARGSWRNAWPALGESDVPRAMRVTLTLASGEAIERWIVLR